MATKPIRRIVTGHNSAGRSVILHDGPAPNASPDSNSTLLWLTDRAPASNRGNEDVAPAGKRVPVPPPKNGTVFRVVDFLPDSAGHSGATLNPSASQIQVDPERSKRHHGFHQTNSVDYAIVLEGEIWAMMDEGETLMKAGDVLIQRGTFHAWSNRSSQPCRVAFILVDAEPLN
ncbi:MAG TPA: cupin domain-containing protein [Candidatus Binataceae bacterium]|nr:cupin domain-containing protein [Candidatus Binataceae bacterium]